VASAFVFHGYSFILPQVIKISNFPFSSIDFIEKALGKLEGQALKNEINVTNACPYSLSVSPTQA